MIINTVIDPDYLGLVHEVADRAKQYEKDFAVPPPTNPVEYLQDLKARVLHPFSDNPEQDLLRLIGKVAEQSSGKLSLPADSALRERYEKWDISAIELAKTRAHIINETLNSRLDWNTFINVCCGDEGLEIYTTAYKLVSAYEAVIKALDRKVDE